MGLLVTRPSARTAGRRRRPGRVERPGLAAATTVVALLAALLAAPGALGQELPVVDPANPAGVVITTDTSPNPQMTITQSAERAVIRWSSFSIGQDAGVHFLHQQGARAATLNIVTGSGASILAGELTATGSVFLINPHGITVTETGEVNTGGMFVASTLADVNETAFLNGDDRLVLQAASGSPAGDVANAGSIRGRDVALIGARVANSGEILAARLGRVALASGSHAVLDLSGDGFLQVLAPADIADALDTDDSLPLVANSGSIAAEGGLVHLEAFTAYKAVRQAINMGGVIEARNVSGEPGRIVFGTGDGSPIVVSGILDVRPADGETGASGGQVEIAGSKVALDFTKLRIGEGGSFSLAADSIQIQAPVSDDDWDDSAYEEGDTTYIFDEGTPGGRSDIGDLLRAGVNVRLHGNREVMWDGGIIITSAEVEERTVSGKAGDLHLVAGERILLDGVFQNYNSNWTMTVNARPVSGIQLEEEDWTVYAYIENRANFINNNGHLTMRIVGGEESAGLAAGEIDLPELFSGAGLTAEIDGRANEYEDSYIAIRGNIIASGDITLSGHLRTILQTTDDPATHIATLKGASVTWTTETEDRLMGLFLRFIEVRNGREIMTRFGRGGSYGSPGVDGDATRLILGSSGEGYSRLYGDSNPGQAELGSLILSLAPHNKRLPGEGARERGWLLTNIPEGGIPLTEILELGSIAVDGPGPKAIISALRGEPYYLTLAATGEIAFKPVQMDEVAYEDPDLGWVEEARWVSGAAGAYWINLAPDDLDGDGKGDGAKVTLEILPRPLTIEALIPTTYVYGTPEPLVHIDNLVEGDDVAPLVLLTKVVRDHTETGGETLQRVGAGFGLPAEADRGEYIYSVLDITGEDAPNYNVDVRSLPSDVRFFISPRTITYTISDLSRVYGSDALPAADLDGLLEADKLFVRPVVGLFKEGEHEPNSIRLAVGTYTAKVVGLTGDRAHNYEVVVGPSAYLTVTPRTLSWRVADSEGVYGTLASVGEVIFPDLLEGDELIPTVAVLRQSDQAQIMLEPRTPSGTYTMVATALGGPASGNYRLAENGNTPGRLRIFPRQLSLATTQIVLTYGDTSGGREIGQFPLPALVGVLDGDEVGLNPANFFLRRVDPDSAYPNGVDISVGRYYIEPYSDGGIAWDPLTGEDAGNYELPKADAQVVSLVVEPKTLFYSITAPAVEYGDLPAFHVTLDGVVVREGHADNVEGTGLEIRHGTAVYPWPYTLDVGEYEVTIRSLTGNAAGNYRLATTGNTPGTLRVDPKLVNPVLSYRTAVYGDALLMPYDDGVQLRLGAKLDDGGVTDRPNAGIHTSVVLELVGPHAYRYRLVNLEDRHTGVLEVQRRPVTVTLLDYNRTYGDPLSWMPIVVDNLAPGDQNRPERFSFQVSRYGETSPFHERTPVGTYTLTVVGLDNPNYTLADEGHTSATVTIFPRPVRYTTYDRSIAYGNEGTYLGDALLFADDILPGDAVWAGAMVVRDRDGYPLYLEAGRRYPLMPGSLEGPAAGNYVLRHEGSEIGYLTVTPREILFTQNQLVYMGSPLVFDGLFGSFEKAYGLITDPEAFDIAVNELIGLLPSDDVRYVVQRPELRFSTQGYLAAGRYVWTLELAGSSAKNYVLPATGTSFALTIEPRPVEVFFEFPDLIYGDAFEPEFFRVIFDFAGDDDSLFAGADFELAPTTIFGAGLQLPVDELWFLGEVAIPQAGNYWLLLTDPDAHPFNGPDAGNFTHWRPVDIVGRFTVQPRPLYLLPPAHTRWIYGSTPNSFDGFYGGIAGPDDGRPAILPGDDVKFEFVQGWRVAEDGSRTDEAYPVVDAWLPVGGGTQWFEVPDPRARVGTYGYFEWRLAGGHAASYVLIQPTYTITIDPRPLFVAFERDWRDANGRYLTSTYGNPLGVRAGPYGGVLPDDDCCTVIWRDAQGEAVSVSQLKVGDYPLAFELQGAAAGNYTLVVNYGEDAYLRITPREILYSIADVVGQYGNYLPCDDPFTCNGGPRWGEWDWGNRWANVWQPGLTTGAVELLGVLPGDDVRPGEVHLVDVLGRVGRLEDVPPPGLYFQVLASIEGDDARNYYIAESGSRPGLMQIHRTWLFWQTYEAIYTPEWGFLSYHPGTDSLGKGLGADLWMGADRVFVKPKLGLYWYHANYPDAPLAELPRVEPWAVRNYPGLYWIVVEGFEGEADQYFIPFPYTEAARGTLTAFADATLGMDMVQRVANPFSQPVATVEQRQQQEQQELEAQGARVVGGSRSPFANRAGADAAFQQANIWRFGADIDYETALSSYSTGRAYAGTLASYGITGVRLEAGAGVEVVFDLGAGYVRVGADSGAMARADLGTSSVSATAEASVGTSVGGGVEGGLGNGVTGSLGAELGAMAQARAKIAYGFKDGKLKLGHEAKAGAGLEFGLQGGIDLGGMEYDVGVTVYSPGVFANDVAFGFGVSDGKVTLAVKGGIALGIGGISISIAITIDLEALQGMGCSIGLVSCPPTWEDRGRDQLQAALAIADPVQRAAYLAEHAEWANLDRGSLSPDLRRAYDEHVQLLRTFRRLQENVERYAEAQVRRQEDFLYYLNNDPQRAMEMARNIMRREQLFGGYEVDLARSIQEDLDALGLRLQVSSTGTVTFQWKGK